MVHGGKKVFDSRKLDLDVARKEISPRRRKEIRLEIFESERTRLAHGERLLRRTAIVVLVLIVAGILLAVYYIETPQRLFDSYLRTVKRSELKP